MPELTTAPRPFCFVGMPFSSEFTDIYQHGIKPACEAGGRCDRVDEQHFYRTRELTNSRYLPHNGTYRAIGLITAWAAGDVRAF